MERLMLRRAALAAVISVIICTGWWFKTRPDGQLHLIFPNLAGDGILLKTPQGSLMVIDGSRDAVGLTALTAEHLPLWKRSLGALIITRSDGLRLPGALALARHYTFDHSLLPPTRNDPTALSLVRTLASHPTRINPLEQATTLTIDGVMIRVLLPPDEEGGAVLLLEFGEFRALLAPAVSDDQAASLLQHPPSAAVLWWPWERPDGRQMADAIGAQAIVYSEGEGHLEATNALTFDARGGNHYRLLHKALHGTIHISANGSQMVVTTEH